MDIDIRTLFFVFSSGNLFIVLFLSAFVLLYEIKRSVINLFLAAKVMLFVLYLLFAFRNKIPDFYSIAVANVLLLFATFYELYSIMFAERKFSFRHLVRLHILPAVLSSVFLLSLNLSETNRVIVASVLLSVLFLVTSFYLLFAKQKTKIQRLSGYFATFLSMVLLSRMLWVLFIDRTTMLFTTNHLQILSYVSMFLVSFSWAVVLLLILREKDIEIIQDDNHKLNELNQSKDKFFSIIAHDLRSPLNNLYMIGELLWSDENDIDELKRRDYTEKLYLNAKRTFNLVDNLLKWASANSGMLKYAPSRVNLQTLVEENIHVLNPIAEQKGVKINNQIVDEVIVWADYSMINTVVRNLLSNAIKFTPQTGIIKIICEEKADHFTLAISDTGVGIPRDALVGILKLDSGISTRGTNNEKGSGLGLKLCKEFIDANKGRLWIESTVNRGTSVWISLPKEKKAL